MTFTAVGVCLAAALVLALVLFRGQRAGDGDWGRLAVCEGCGKELPRWFFVDRNAARGPYSLYRYPIPTRCRICRHQKGIVPVAWDPGETEAAYNQRSAKIAADFIASRQR